jgi:2-methylcitrate dehydratase PrpD
MTEMRRLINENGIKASDVERVRVGTNHNMPNALIHHRPNNELQAKFSMEFCMAILLLEGRAGLTEFTDEVVHRDDVRAMIEKVDFVVDDEAEAAGYDKMTTLIDIHLKNGRKISGRSDFGKGSPANPMSYDEVAEKFRETAGFGKLGKQSIEDVIAMVRDLESLNSIEHLMGPLRI